MDLTTCTNCKSALVDRFCATCGQPAFHYRQSLPQVLKEAAQDLLGADGRVWRTLRALLFQPGELALAFREGRTHSYLPAFRFYLFLSVGFFFLLAALNVDMIQIGAKERRSVPVKVDWAEIARLQGQDFKFNGKTYGMFKTKSLLHIRPDDSLSEEGFTILPSGEVLFSALNSGAKSVGYVDDELSLFSPHILILERAREHNMQSIVRDQIVRNAARTRAIPHPVNPLVLGLTSWKLRLTEDPNALNDPISVWISRFLLILMPLFGFVLVIFYRHRNLYAVDHIMFSLTIHSALFAALSIFVILGLFLPHPILVPALVGGFEVYCVLALKRFYGDSWPKTLVKSVMITAAYAFLMLLTVLAICAAALIS
jgi:hypothetical protein